MNPFHLDTRNHPMRRLVPGNFLSHYCATAVLPVCTARKWQGVDISFIEQHSFHLLIERLLGLGDIHFQRIS